MSLILLACLEWLHWQQDQAGKQRAEFVARTHEVQNNIERLMILIEDIETGTRGFVITGDTAFLEPFGNASRAIPIMLNELKATILDAKQRKTLIELVPLIAERIDLAKKIVDLRRKNGFEAARQEIARSYGQVLTKNIRTQLAQMIAMQQRLLEKRSAYAKDQAIRSKLTRTMVIILSFAILIAVFAVMMRENRLRQEINSALRTSEGNLAVTLQSIGDGVLATDVEGRITQFNTAAEELTGWTQAEVVGRPVEDIFHIINEETRQPEVIPVTDTLAKSTMHCLAYQTLLIARDGTERLIANSCAPILDQEQKAIGAVLVFRDVTAEKAAELELRRSRAVFENLFTSLPGHFLVLTPELKIVAASDAYLESTMTKREEIVGREMFEVFPDNPDDPESDGTSKLRASLQRVCENKTAETLAIVKYDIPRPDGVFEERYWSPINSPVLGVNRQLEYIIHRAEDVTDFMRQNSQSAGGDTAMERMKAEIFHSSQMLQATNRKLETANKELEAFSYSVSHDLRAPLRHVLGYTEMLIKAMGNELTGKPLRYLNTIRAATEEMGQLIDDLLAFSQVGRTDLSTTKISMDDLVRDAIRDLEMITEDRQIQWNIAPLPQVIGDRAMLKQVLANLIGNAVKYSKGREPAIIQIGSNPNEDGQIVFYVRDNGAGFDMRYVNKLFGVFQRLHRADEFEGTGIGLATVRRIVSRHGGQTWAEGEVGVGATFSFSLRSST